MVLGFVFYWFCAGQDWLVVLNKFCIVLKSLEFGITGFIG